jgi:thiol peroxidase
MTTVEFKGKPVEIKGKLPAVGETAPDFTYVKADGSEGTLVDDVKGKVKVIIAVPSLDTGVCQMETRKFNEALSQREGVTGLVVSMDLHFAMRRFCEAEGIQNVSIGSDYRYNDFVQEYNTLIKEGAMKGLSARAVLVLDEALKIHYSELVPAIGQEPQYDQALAAVDRLLAR